MWVRQKNDRAGFTIIELLVVIVIIGILLAIVAATYAGVQRNQRNHERQTDIQQLYQALEAYYQVNTKYPTLADMNNSGWIKTNMKTLDSGALHDPSASSSYHQLAAKPVKNAYAYDVTAADGSSCDNDKKICAHYTLTATLENSPQKTFVKSSLN